MRSFLSVLFVISIVCSRAMAQGSSNNVAQPRPDAKGKVSPEIPSRIVPEEYVIGPEDVLSISVWHEPELSSKVSVRPDGKIGISLLNDVPASGLTPKQLTEQITQGLAKFLTTPPQVSVIVLEIHSQVVYITGAVHQPGVYVLGKPMTVMELLVRAGGLGEYAKSQDIQVLRNEATTPIRFRFNFKRFSEGKDYKQNILLKSGDMVVVP